MAKAKSSSSKRKAKEPIVEIEGVEEMPASNEEAKSDTPVPNVQYSGDPKYPAPPKQVRIGMKVIQLPDAEMQRQGFYSPFAEKLARTIKAYKLIQPKG